MTLAVRRSLRVVRSGALHGVRVGRVAGTLLISLLAVLSLLHVPPFMAPGADLTDPSQREYATNIWQETQTSLALLGLVLPWMLYALLWPGAAWGRRALLAVSAIAVVGTTWLALISAQSYTALPREVTGVLDRVQGREVSLQGEGSYYLVVSDQELGDLKPILRPGTSVLLWVSPRGHVGSVSRVALGD